ncbi:hypothetical protein RF11_02852 [Thelohanellus kitauei]|uniref:Uncharacterized protein n=1 Tax=Thelohanellus kitauei TaxID=669202 RepID=A0A0C2IBM4_THEKT|nr:hypothetical protein RF11_02852 [Thelohanellus kitauei]
MDGFEVGDKIANLPCSSHDQRGENFYKKKMLNYNKNPIELRNKASTLEPLNSEGGAKFTLVSIMRVNEFVPSFSRDSVSSGEGASNEEAKSVSPLRTVAAYVCHAKDIPPDGD